MCAKCASVLEWSYIGDCFGLKRHVKRDAVGLSHYSFVHVSQIRGSNYIRRTHTHAGGSVAVHFTRSAGY